MQEGVEWCVPAANDDGQRFAMSLAERADSALLNTSAFDFDGAEVISPFDDKIDLERSIAPPIEIEPLRLAPREQRSTDSGFNQISSQIWLFQQTARSVPAGGRKGWVVYQETRRARTASQLLVVIFLGIWHPSPFSQK